MARQLVVVASVAAAALAVATAANAKGASQATISGPGLGSPIVLGGGGNGDAGPATKLGALAGDAGFFPAVFGQSPDPMLPARPTGDLGPRYVAIWVMPGPSGTKDQIRQDLYPYAKPWPVTYTPAGQKFFGTQRTRGGWFEASPILKATLRSAGLPAVPPGPSSGGGSLSSGETAIVVVAALALALLGAAAVVVARRRPRPAPAG